MADDEKKRAETGLNPETVHTLHFDLHSGAAGDMLLAALLDAGVDEKMVEEGLRALGFKEKPFTLKRVSKGGIGSKSLQLTDGAEQTGLKWKTYAQGRSVVDRSDLSPGLKKRACEVLDRLAAAEGAIHGVSPEKVHFHEIGAADTLIDIVGVLAAVEWLSPTIITATAPAVGGGTVQTQHGKLPVPAPATLELLRGVEVCGEPSINLELTTPTGAALITHLVHCFRNMPSMRVAAIGYGAGFADLDDRPNVVRAVLGGLSESTAETTAERTRTSSTGEETLVEMRANLDDSSPELAAHLVAKLIETGALDAWITPVTMKKGRPGMVLNALVRDSDRNAFLKMFFEESSTFGVRWNPVRRKRIPRKREIVETRWGMVEVMVASMDGVEITVSPEFESCRNVAGKSGVPLRQVLGEAVAARRLKPPAANARDKKSSRS